MNIRSPQFFAVAVAASVFVGALVVLISFRPAAIESWPSGSVLAESATNHDWGNIDIEGGNVVHAFEFSNDSNEPLEIAGARTSCMCTTAEIEIAGERSPAFGMHTASGGWSGTVLPGESFLVHATFDPMAHGPDSTGPIKRDVELFTSAAPGGEFLEGDKRAPNGSVASLEVSGNVLSADAYADAVSNTSYDVVSGDFAFEETEHDFGVLKQSGGVVEKAFRFRYDGSDAVDIANVVGSCACTTGTTDASRYEPGDEGVLTLRFDPNLHEEPKGRFFKTVVIETATEEDSDPEVKMWAEIDLDLGPEAYTLQEPHKD